MIKNVFFPTQLGSYYVFEQKILSIDIHDTLVSAVLVVCKGNVRTVSYTEHVFLQENTFTQLQQAIKKITMNAGSYDQLITTLKSSLIIYKTLTLPFLDYEKIKMVVPFEIEPHLPFRLDAAVFDFMIMHQDTQKKSSVILVAATQIEHVQNVVQQFEKLKVSLHAVTILPFALYDMYSNSPALHKASGTFMVDFGWDTIQLLYITSQGIEFIRTITFGVSAMFLQAAQKSQISTAEMYEQIIHGQDISLVHDGYKDIIKEIQTSWWAIEKQYGKEKMPSNFVCSGFGIILPNLLQTLQDAFAVQAQSIENKDVVAAYKAQLGKKAKDGNIYQAALVDALAYSKGNQANLLVSLQQGKQDSLLNMQILVAIFLSVLLFAGIYMLFRQENQTWQEAIVSSKKQVVREVERQMKLDVRGEQTHKVVEKAEAFLDREKKLWFSFSKERDGSLLESLQALSLAIDRESLGLVISRMKIDFDEIVIQGSVRDFEALQIFEEELLELKQFDIEQKPRELTFTVKLRAKPKGEK